MIEDVRTYWIEIDGTAAEEEINAATPISMTIIQAGEDKTVLTVSTDQAGLIGLLRHLHGLGFVLLSVRADRTIPSNKKSSGEKNR